MTQENIQISGDNYSLYIQYQKEETLRLEFNRMTNEFWGFDFENYYQSGYWDEKCILYSLFDGDKIISHATVSLFDVMLMGEQKKLAQIGTVMTDTLYQKRGLGRFLMKRIQADFADKIDGMFLFANETVLDYYPKFGLVPASEFIAVQQGADIKSNSQLSNRKLNLDDTDDLNLFERLVESSISNSALTCKSKGLSFFYTYAYPDMGYKDSLYFIPELDCAVVVELEASNLRIVELFSANKVNLQEVIASLGNFTFDKIALGFTPLQDGFDFEVWQDDDLHLFVSPNLRQAFDENKLVIPFLSHT
ncbi:Acetyltransferase (GNAT) domain-containing protein [Sphingobacterium nematocida]|uniref:Acetyltransferase (GNAT) domain-containing protein n=1 Tax=Sphingobacterium nematocida TaxID=1513896 RepID=A0A1T5F2N4_9SPHI|nr:GNAT family N-acetyltransferase [Sphingobacterium nematocida]SKB90411.1 Acetyltransferase (GNAT) domain-containing protein [Sphingobacterium nematocida]